MSELPRKFRPLAQTCEKVLVDLTGRLDELPGLISSAAMALDTNDPYNHLIATIGCVISEKAGNRAAFTKQKIAGRAIYLPGTAVGNFMSDQCYEDGFYSSRINPQHLTYINRISNFCIQLAFDQDCVKPNTEQDKNQIQSTMQALATQTETISEQLDKLTDDEPLCQGLLLKLPYVANAFVINSDIINSTKIVKDEGYPVVSRSMNLFGSAIKEVLKSTDFNYFLPNYEGDGYSIIIRIPPQIVYSENEVKEFKDSKVSQFMEKVEELASENSTDTVKYLTTCQKGYVEVTPHGCNGEIFWNRK